MPVCDWLLFYPSSYLSRLFGRHTDSDKLFFICNRLRRARERKNKNYLPAITSSTSRFIFCRPVLATCNASCFQYVSLNNSSDKTFVPPILIRSRNICVSGAAPSPGYIRSLSVCSSTGFEAG